MKHLAIKPLLSSLLLVVLFTATGYASADAPVKLKQTMKQMKLQYKEALETQSAERFNQSMIAFKGYLKNAQAYDFSPEREAISLEGLNKVERFIDDIPLATADNLTEVQHQLSGIDELRKEYHKKAKPSTWELLLSIFK